MALRPKRTGRWGISRSPYTPPSLDRYRTRTAMPIAPDGSPVSLRPANCRALLHHLELARAVKAREKVGSEGVDLSLGSKLERERRELGHVHSARAGRPQPAQLLEQVQQRECVPPELLRGTAALNPIELR